MSVFFRTGDNSGVSVSWPVYLFGVLPLQMLIGFYKVVVSVAVALFSGLVFLVRKARGHEENGPPAA